MDRGKARSTATVPSTKGEAEQVSSTGTTGTMGSCKRLSRDKRQAFQKQSDGFAKTGLCVVQRGAAGRPQKHPQTDARYRALEAVRRPCGTIKAVAMHGVESSLFDQLHSNLNDFTIQPHVIVHMTSSGLRTATTLSHFPRSH